MWRKPMECVGFLRLSRERGGSGEVAVAATAVGKIVPRSTMGSRPRLCACAATAANAELRAMAEVQSQTFATCEESDR